ncbi:MAG: hypothetical protein L0338_33215, partial [Acidobacteria bacterium]|nr:hypothetical protein [Acidobacteriota bacterium]
KPFTMNHRGGVNSLIDLSFLLDPPAGKNGFIRIQGSHFVKPDGKRIRFWGVNLTDWSKGSVMMPPKEDAPVWAATLARFGVNCVRLHFLDLDSPRGLIDRTRNDSREFDPQQLDRLDFFIAELKKRGIYVNLNLNVGRSYKAGDGVQDYDKIRWAKGLTLYDPRLIELQKEYARKILTHHNPYTKSEYRNDPTVAIVELVNENALYIGFRAPTPYYDNALNEIYNAWLRKKLTSEELSKLRAQAGASGDQPVPRLKGAEVGAASKERFYTELTFYIEMESVYFRDMKAYLKDTLGVKSPIVGTADHSHSGSSYPLLSSTSLLDIVDGHTYWQHPGPRGIPNTPQVNDPFNSTVVELSRTAFANKPYTVSEVNHPYPNEWAAEGIPTLAAYAGFQDWDGIFWYTFEPKLSADWKPYVGDPFDISLDPVKMPQLAAGALMFLRGDVSVARETVERSYTREQVYDSLRLPRTERPYFTPGFPLSIPLQHGSRIRSLEGKPTGKFTAVDANPIVSDTRELSWYLSPDKKGLVTLETERSQALIGFVNEGRKSLRNLDANVSNNFCSIVLTSLDSKPISRSTRMLLTAGARVVNTGMKWNENRSALANWGGPPTLIEPVTGKVILRNIEKATEVRVAALDGAGRPIGKPVNAKRTKDGWEIEIGEPASTWYEVTVRQSGSGQL